MTRSRDSSTAVERVLCRYCGYDLVGISAERCPECGVENPTFCLESGWFRSISFAVSMVCIIVYLLLFIDAYEHWQRMSWYVGPWTPGKRLRLIYAGFWLAYSFSLAAYAVLHRPEPKPLSELRVNVRWAANVVPLINMLMFMRPG